MLALYAPAVLAAFLITLLELTEVVALVFALSADAASVRPTALGATSGTAAVSISAFAVGSALLAFPHEYLLVASAIVLLGFGAFLFRSTLRSYRRAAQQRAGIAPPPPAHRTVQFGGGFTVGVIETTEAAVVLIAIAAAGYGPSAVVGAVAGGVVLVAVAASVHDRIRRIKVPWLKLGATSLLLSFAVFWAGEALGVAWPGGDLVLVPLVIVFALAIRGAIAGLLRGPRPAPV